ncbi:MAG: hypothetical protein NW224_05675 [Leptolyngbyaceae cyanobacterium bins.302]|nr:hypothetical protein [Leptolyngbyaceae cyanobacterium bins.302]
MRLNSNGSNRAKSSPQPSLQHQIERIFAAGRITRREHLSLTSALLAGQQMTESDRLQINQVLESIQLGKLELMD